MPVNHQKSGSSEMDADMSPSCRLGDVSRGGSVESRSRAQSRSFSLDDESLQYLTHEEKDVILFFEETLDSLADDFEDAALGDGGSCCHSPPTPEESPASPWEPGEVIDLVQPGPTAGGAGSLPDVLHTAGNESAGQDDVPVLEGKKEDAENTPLPDSRDPEAPPQPPVLPSDPEPAPPRKELLSPGPPSEHPKLLRSIPTPLVIAQKMSEKLAGSDALSPTSPSKEGRPGEWRTLLSAAPRNGDHPLWHRHTAQPSPKIHRFPSNISVTNSSGKDFNKTISKAAVNVQERKAQVLANINGVSFLASGDMEGRPPRGDIPEQRDFCPDQSRPGLAKEAEGPQAGGPASGQQSRAVQTEQPPLLANGFQSIHEALKSEPSVFIPTGKTITFRPDPALASKLARQNASRSLYQPQPPDCNQNARKRAGSLPRAVGFRPQGITVQFSGRGSTEEARREALRKLGLLKENL
ncbi:proline and serine-rich protein 2 [Dipodomys spectabilis]|uniref:proline and serine-rich protein 2 n=1 Tax=Dipodomys spectabilis TaxID=105255 RepID=UPI001C5435D6|nr:proline and serine-rich protein 2 [Dipodomys spectabilis]